MSAPQGRKPGRRCRYCNALLVQDGLVWRTVWGDTTCTGGREALLSGGRDVGPHRPVVAHVGAGNDGGPGMVRCLPSGNVHPAGHCTEGTEPEGRGVYEP